MSDSEQLERELNYKPPQRDTRFFKTHPPGYNVINGMGAFFGLSGFLLGLLATVTLLGRGGFAEVLGFIVGLIFAAIFGWKLPRAIWRGIGPSGRSVLRVFGYLGSGGTLIFCFLAAALLVGGLKGVIGSTPTAENAEMLMQTPAQTVTQTPTIVEEAPLSGADWQVLVGADGKPLKLTLAEARARCKAMGNDWRLPRLNDMAMVDSKVKNPAWTTCVLHFDSGKNLHGKLEFDKNLKTWRSTATKDDSPRQVLLIRGDSL